MRCVGLVLVITTLAVSVCRLWSAPDNWREILERVRQNVTRQVAKSVNYTCVQTVDRTSFANTRDLLTGCAYESNQPDKREIMHDRLRLDVAVSRGKEIHAWHGEGKFSGSSRIGDVVGRGTVSSGEFIGFLGNIFSRPGIRFEYAGEFTTNGEKTYSFNYTVPLSSSGYHVGTRHGNPVIPYHGSFSVRAADFKLASLIVIADDIPKSSQLCSVETEMQYQIANISGQESLIPALFILKVDDETHTYEVSRSEYSQCRAFGAESTIRFDGNGSSATGSATAPEREQFIPAGKVLQVGLRTPIDDRTSYTGDLVKGVLLRAVKLGGTPPVIPKGSEVRGVITLLEDHQEPKHFHLLTIRWDELSFGTTVLQLRASPLPLKVNATKLIQIFGSLTPSVKDVYDRGVFVFRTPHFHLDESFSAYWKTETRPTSADPAAGSSAQ